MPRYLRLRNIAAVGVVAVAAVFGALANNGAYNPTVQEYYESLESRLGYALLLGKARHCGLYEKGTIWPLPIGKALRAMEEKLYSRLGLSQGSYVLDAGAGAGIVAAYMASKGLRVQGIDLTPLHVRQSQDTIKSYGLQDLVSVSQGDYHNLSAFPDRTFDGVYTMETFVHAKDALQVLGNFMRVLKPGGTLVLHEADFHWDSDSLQDILRLSACQNTLAEGSYEKLLTKAGFKNVTVEDLSDEVLPLWRLFGWLGAIPYEITRLFGLEKRFTNTLAGVEIYRHWGQGRYISVRAEKPL